MDRQAWAMSIADNPYLPPWLTALLLLLGILAVLVWLWLPFILIGIRQRLDRLIALTQSANDQRSEGNTSSETPSRQDGSDDDLTIGWDEANHKFLVGQFSADSKEEAEAYVRALRDK